VFHLKGLSPHNQYQIMLVICLMPSKHTKRCCQLPDLLT